MIKEIELIDYLEYTKLYYNLAMKHKLFFGEDKHPHLPSLYTEGIIKKILGMNDLEGDDKSTKKKHIKKCDSKLQIGNITYLFEIKATGSKIGKTTINNSSAHYVLWGFFDCAENKLDLNLKLINMDKIKKNKDIKLNFKKNSRSNITLNYFQNEDFEFKISLLGGKEENLTLTIKKVKTQLTNFLKKQAKAK